jgi:hypothetical protein
VLAVALFAACGRGGETRLGEPVEVSSAVPLAECLGRAVPEPGSAAVVSGRVREVCRTAGCWFVLEDAAAGTSWELLVDLKPAAGFTVTPGIAGKQVVVSGRFAGRGPDLRLNASGLVIR